MESDYFEKTEKRFNELAKEGYALSLGRRYWLSLKEILPDLPPDTFCSHDFVVRFHEQQGDEYTFKSMSFRMYDEDTGKWSDWEYKDVEYSPVYKSVVLEGKEIYVFNALLHEGLYYPHLMMYSPEMLSHKFVYTDDEGQEKEAKVFPWVYIDVSRSDTYSGDGKPKAFIKSFYGGSNYSAETARNLLAERIVETYREDFHIPENINIFHDTPAVVRVAKLLDKGEIPAQILMPPHANYDGAMFPVAQAEKLINERVAIIEGKIKEIEPEFYKLKKIVEMSNEGKAQLIEEEKKKEQAKKKEKAEKRAARKEMEAKESKLSNISIVVYFVAILFALIPLFFAEDIDYAMGSEYLAYLFTVIILVAILVPWRFIKKNLKKKWGIKEED